MKGGRTAAVTRASWGIPSVVSGLLILLAAVGAPLSQVLRVAEVAPLQGSEKRSAPQYTLVLASALEAPALPASKSDAKAADEKKSEPKQNDVRLLKILDEQWETTARVQLDADVPTALELILQVEEAFSPEPIGTQHFVCLEFSPPNPPARGPPL
jgi:hypothetical protein